MADDELKKLLGEEVDKPAPPAEEIPQEQKSQTEEEAKIETRHQELEALEKAKREALAEISRLRKEKKSLKNEPDEEIPQINRDDPGAKAWMREIKDNVAPVVSDIEKAKEERLKYALSQFLDERPTIAKDPEKLKRMMGTYEKLKDNSGLTSEGIFLDLTRAYNAEFTTDTEVALRQVRLNQARSDEAFAAPGVSRGATSYKADKPQKRQYTEDEIEYLKTAEKFGMPKLDE